MKGVGQHLTLPLCLVLALAVSGCVQTTAENFVKPAGPTAGNPLVLSSAAGGTAPPAATPGEPAPATDTAAAPAALTNEPPPPATAAPVIKEPVATPVSAPEPASVPASGPADATVPAAPQTANSYPNINVAPQEPSGTLLPPNERKRIISELEALRDGQSKPAPKAEEAPATLTKEAETHGTEALKKIKKCSQEGAADKYPECAAAKSADQTPADQAPAN